MSIQVPQIVALLTHNFDAWIVGSAADPENTTPRDYDIIVPYYNWNPAASLIPKDAIPNSFGGWKCKTPEGIEVDVWPGDLGWIMQRPKAKYAYHPKSGTRIKKETE